MTKLQDIAKAYLQSLKDHPGKRGELQDALISFLKDHKMEKQAPGVLKEVRAQLKKSERAERFELHSSREPDQALLEKVSKKFDVPVDDIVVVVDPEIIAGIKVYYKGNVLDGSLKNQLSAK
jgi:F0F1-type ATP synthase delta subunit